LIGGTTAPIFNTQFMKRETWEILLALESGKISVIDAHKKIMANCASILNDCMDKKQEVLMNPIRFEGVHVEKLAEVFRRNGIEHEPLF
jgi:hypothetical protein